MRLGVLVLLAGCDRLFGIHNYPAVDAGGDARSDDAWQAPMLVQQAVASSPGASKITVALGHPPTTSNVLIAIGGAQNGVASIAGGGVTWQLAASSEVSPTSYMWFGVTDGSTASTELTTSTAGQIWLAVTEWTGLDDVATFDGESSNGLVGATAINLSLPTSSAPDLLLFGVSCYGTIGNPMGTWLELPPVTAGTLVQHAWYRVSTLAGVQTAQTACSADWDATVAAFRTAP